MSGFLSPSADRTVVLARAAKGIGFKSVRVERVGIVRVFDGIE